MKNFIFACFAMLQLASCKPNISKTPTDAPASSTQSTLPPAEQKALAMTATALVGTATGLISPDGKAIEIIISNSATMEQEADLLPLHSSNAAWVFYKNVGNEKPTYEKIVVKSQLSDTTIIREYTMQELAIVKARMPTFETAAKLLVAADYQGLYEMFDPAVMGSMKVKGLEEYCTQIEPQYGKPVAAEFRGFSFNKTSTGKEFLSLAGPLRRQTKDTAFDIAVDLTKPDMKGSISAIKFDY
jgi:hypothetical protein